MFDVASEKQNEIPNLLLNTVKMLISYLFESAICNFNPVKALKDLQLSYENFVCILGTFYIFYVKTP